MNHCLTSFARGLAVGGLMLGLGLSPSSAQDPKPVKPDNTKVNKRDRDASAPTADNQKQNKPDRRVAADIRRAIVKDKSLSTYAHNVKVIVQGGNVTLKGPVRSEDEKKAVESKAAEVAGAGKVTNDLSVTSKSAKTAKTKTKRHRKAADQT